MDNGLLNSKIIPGAAGAAAGVITPPAGAAGAARVVAYPAGARCGWRLYSPPWAKFWVQWDSE